MTKENKENTDIINKIKEAIEEMRLYINMDGGDIEFVKYDNHIVYVRLSGACQACMYSDDTLQNGVYETLRNEIPEIEGVINVPI